VGRWEAYSTVYILSSLIHYCFLVLPAEHVTCRQVFQEARQNTQNNIGQTIIDMAKSGGV